MLMLTSSKIFNHFVDLLNHRANDMTNKVAYTYIINGEEAVQLTYGELDRKARSVAAYLKKQYAVCTGDRALLVYPPGLEFITSFFGCLYAGVIAVPSVPPNKHSHRLQSIIKDSQPSLGLTSSKLLKGMQGQFSNKPLFNCFNWVATDELIDSDKFQIERAINKDSIAFLQYTSGSTGNPKGVMVTHSNLLHNSKMLQKASHNTSESIIVNWLPLYHDMGIIGSILQPLYVGATCVTMSPLDFLQKPYRWLKAITDYKATYSGAPDFGYNLCVSKVTEEQINELDLSSWKTAFNGSDQVRHSTIEAFINKFERCGFKREAFYPTFGLAEATLMVTGGLNDNPPKYHSVKRESLEENGVIESSNEPEDRKIVSLGKPWIGQTVKITNPNTLVVCGENEVGEIWVSGDSVAKGYWNNPEATTKTFEAYTANGEGPFLRTGDLGYLNDGELYFVGRIKDVIIIRGKNHFPQDIELTVENCHSAFVSNGSAAFSVDRNDEERLVVAVEVNRRVDYDGPFNNFKKELLKKVRRAITEHHEIQLYDLVLVKEGSIPKTSSGKVQRNESKEKYMQSSLNLFNMDT